MSNLQRNNKVPDVEVMLNYIVAQNPEGVTEFAYAQGMTNPPVTERGMVRFLLKATQVGDTNVAEAVMRLHPDFALFDSFIREEISSTIDDQSFNGNQPKQLSPIGMYNGFESFIAHSIVNDRNGFIQVLKTIVPNLPLLISDSDLVEAALSLSDTGKASLYTLMGNPESNAAGAVVGAVAQGVGALANLGSAAIQGGTQKKLANIQSRDNTLNSITALQIARVQAKAANQPKASNTNQTLIWVGSGFAFLVIIGLILFLVLKRN